jgi:hypothetical protein
MIGPIRRVGIGIGIIAFVAASAPTFAQTQPDTRPPCLRALVSLEDSLDSARAKSGDVFKFRLAEPEIAPDGTPLPLGTLGYGVVANASHADRGGRAGYLALEVRFFQLENGKHVPAIIDRVNDQGATALGATANAPGLLGLIPFVGYAVGGYDAMHHGKDATIPRGTRVAVFIGDDAALGSCRAPVPGETATPATPAPVAVPPAVPASTPSPSPTA